MRREFWGKGAAINPEEGNYVSPVKGTVITVFETKHAIGIAADTGAEILLHVGLNTVNLQGRHFEALVKDGDAVEVGTPILKVDLKALREAGYDTITPVLVTNSMDYAEVTAMKRKRWLPEKPS